MSVTEMLRQGADTDAWRTYVQQLNHYLAEHPSAQPRRLGEDERTFLTNEASLDKSELAEVASPTFTPLDAHYLDLAFVLRDTLGSLNLDGLAPLDRATKGFAWVIRQVRLQQGESITVPPLLVLRRGWGTAQERDLIFLSLLDQLGIDGCMVVLPAGMPGQFHNWVPGALIDKDVYLFDTRLGLPLPGPDSKGVATLREVREGLDLRQILKVEDKYPYDVSPESARQAEVRVAYSLSALAPRMEFLQNYLATSAKVNLWIDPVARFERFQAVTQPLRVPVHVWGAPSDANNPLRVLRAFLTPEEGGVAQKPFCDLLRQQAVPWESFPQQVRLLPGKPGQQLQAIFAAPFVYFNLETRMPPDLLVDWLPGLSEASVDKPGTRRPSENLVRSPLPRYLMLHGRSDEAASLLVTIHAELRRQKALPGGRELDEAVRRWCERAIEAYSDLIRAEDMGKFQPNGAKGVAPSMGVLEAKERVNQLWGPERIPVVVLLQKSAAEPMLDRVVYLLALCKQEQAERLQVRRDQLERLKKAVSPAEAKASLDAWKSASSWWGSYLNEHASSPAAPAARLLRARALEALGQRENAIALLENLSGVSNELEKTSRLYLAKQLKSHSITRRD